MADFTIEQLYKGLEQADAAGNKEDVAFFLQEIETLEKGGQEQKPKSKSEQALLNFNKKIQDSRVKSSIDSDLLESKIEERLKYNSEYGVFQSLADVRKQVKEELSATPEIPKEKTEVDNLVERQGGLDAFLINAGKIFVDTYDVVGEQFGLDPVKDRSEIEQKAIDLLKESRPITSFLGEAAPSIATLASGVIPAATVGALEGLGLSKSTPEDDALQSAGIGAGVAAGAEILFPKISKLARTVFRKFKGTDNLVKDGVPTEAFQKTLDDSDISYTEIKEAGLTPEDLVGLNENGLREKFFRNQGIEPTKGQVTRNNSDILKEAELAKPGKGKVAERFEEQNKKLLEKAENFVSDTGGSKKISALAPDAEENLSFTDFIIKDDKNVREGISKMYSNAIEEIGDAKTINVRPIIKTINNSKGVNSKSIPFLTDIENQTKRTIMANKDSKGLIDAKTSEDLVQFINSKLNKASPDFKEEAELARIIKDEITDITINTTKSDSLKKARNAAADNFRLINRDKLNKYDTSTKNIIEDLIAGDIDQGEIVNKLVRSKSVKKKDLKHVKDYLSTKGEGGKKAWDDLRTQTIDDILEKSVTSKGEFNAKAFNTNFNNIGMDKANVLFDRNEVKELRKLERLSQELVPKGKSIGKGPSSLAIADSRDNLLASLTSLGGVVENSVSNFFKELPNKRANKQALKLPEGRTKTAQTADLTQKIADIVSRNLATTEALQKKDNK